MGSSVSTISKPDSEMKACENEGCGEMIRGL